MSKLLIVLLLFFSLLLGGLVYVAITFKDNPSSFKIPFQNSPTPTITSLQSLTLSPENTTITPGQTNTINIILETQKNDPKPQLVQMEISFDPTALFDVDIVPGNFFTNPTETLKTINTHTGRISYALAADAASETPAPTHAVNVAKITFIPNPAFTSRETVLSFLGKTKILGKGNDSIITATYGTRLFFASNSAIPKQ